ncbi:MAG: transcription antitermination factor NusB [Oscillospiraceae bacterium]|jgi:N utilization substance protein B|nr:MAG: transcription antitermination factor NusB [Oscillospiraceae bacterium]
MLNRRSSREAVLGLIFENEFGLYDDKTELYENAVAARGIEENEYIRTLYFGILEKQNELDAYIEKYAKGRTLARISKIAKAVMRISIYEMLYIDDIPASVSINEAVELAKQYDDDKTKAFVNGILNAVKEELGK